MILKRISDDCFYNFRNYLLYFTPLLLTKMSQSRQPTDWADDDSSCSGTVRGLRSPQSDDSDYQAAVEDNDASTSRKVTGLSSGEDDKPKEVIDAKPKKIDPKCYFTTRDIRFLDQYSDSDNDNSKPVNVEYGPATYKDTYKKLDDRLTKGMKARAKLRTDLKNAKKEYRSLDIKADKLLGGFKKACEARDKARDVYNGREAKLREYNGRISAIFSERLRISDPVEWQKKEEEKEEREKEKERKKASAPPKRSNRVRQQVGAAKRQACSTSRFAPLTPNKTEHVNQPIQRSTPKSSTTGSQPEGPSPVEKTYKPIAKPRRGEWPNLSGMKQNHKIYYYENRNRKRGTKAAMTNEERAERRMLRVFWRNYMGLGYYGNATTDEADSSDSDREE